MKVSYNWIKQYINTTLSAEEAAAHLTAIGLEVEGVEKVESVPGGLAGLVVAEVVTCSKHPDADKLNITTVNVGDGGELLQVVCGAPNCRAGIKVVLATVGTTLYPVSMGGEALKIKRSKIRGVESLGMLCAEDEIGIGESHDGIIILPDTAVVGTPAAEVFELKDDYLMEIGLTPNRIDAASHYGVARDLAAFLASSLGAGCASSAVLPDVSGFDAGTHRGVGDAISVKVENSELAPRYMGVTLRGVQVMPSPQWIQDALRSIGINPKNNIVDITNYVLHECGQPLHAFDVAKVEGGEIRVQRCEAGTPFTTLDGVERKLRAEDLMICDARGPLCLAGVFGGLESGVSDTTTDIFIESAYFNPVSVRRSARAHGLSTDSSFRFERGCDPNMAPWALRRAALLIMECGGGYIVGDVVDVYPQPINDFKFTVDLSRINRLLGKEIGREVAVNILSALEIAVSGDGDIVEVNVPVYRVDVQRECDIAEEILRIYGFNNIENPSFIKNVITEGNRPTADRLVGAISTLFASMGATEIMNNSLTSGDYYQQIGGDVVVDRCVKILNPLSGELNVMRQNLLFGALECVALNSARRNSDLRFFEFGNCYFYNDGASVGSTDGALSAYSQGLRLGITVTGVKQGASWNNTAGGRRVDIFDLKLYFERMMQRLGLDVAQGVFSSYDSPMYTVGNRYEFRGNALMEIGQVSAAVCKMMDIKNPVYYMEVDVDRLVKLARGVRVSVGELSKYQRVSRDLALLVDRDVTFAALRDLCYKGEKKLLASVNLFDVYQGEKLPVGKKSYAINLIIEDKSKTLVDSDIERIMGNVIKQLESGAGAQVRAQ